jgi:hypothetical protein
MRQPLQVPKTLERDEWLSRLGTKTRLKGTPSPSAPLEGVSTFRGRLTADQLKKAMNGPKAEAPPREVAWYAQVGCLLDAGFAVTPDRWRYGQLHVTVSIWKEWSPEVSAKFLACFINAVELPIEGA